MTSSMPSARRYRMRPQTVLAPQVVATQVKEKFGTLRFYASGHNSAQDGMIELAEMLSARLCELCGNRGRLYRDEWIIRTRCPNTSGFPF
ncbi:hypothetical protein F6X40_05975 [Paraburkholderia sp. UCT31]|uniref:hypothetical protein n=1 Tax=Paraburkholderia sp. UCT31 TaxID=2615209 RepID=UPI0016567AB4|nr:hypothetical protein [Paraburkholderia sp. UCT31]MBC8736383.1 hypothetical protein [Paraburkholderia sp. UCT31]